MNANDLRIGNYLKIGNQHESYNCNGKIIKWELSNFYSIEKGYNNIEWFEPIPLTEKWLNDFGFFTVKVGKLIDATLPNFRFSLHKSGNYDGFLFCENDNVITNIDYVHQLQNLYFALTGNELVVSDAVS